MYLRHILFILSFCLTAIVTVAQSTVDKTISAVEKTVETLDDTAEKLGTGYRDSDTTYIEYYDELGVHLYAIIYENNFSLNDNRSKNEIHYQPVKSPAFGFGISKYGFNLSVSNDFGLIIQSENKYGKTEKFNINLSFILKKKWITTYFSKYKGYYISNYTDFIVKNNEYPQREDVVTLGYGLSYMHVFNGEKISINSSYTLTQKQLKSAGSFLIGGAISYYSINGDSSLIPSGVHEMFSPYSNAAHISQQLYEISFGYTYNLVFLKHLNLNLTAIAGFTNSFSDIKTIDPKYNTNNYFDVSPSIRIMSALSYVRRRVYFGAYVKMNRSFAETSEITSMSTSFFNAQLFLGYRLGTRKRK